MFFSELAYEEMYAVNGGCGLCDAGTIIGSAGTLGGIAAGLLLSTPVVVAAIVVGGALGYLLTA